MDFSQIALLLVVAATFGIISKLAKQPLIIGYLFAGFSLAFFGIISDGAPFESLSQIGVTLLLFLLGVEMNLNDLPSIGKVALITGIGQIIFTSSIGFFLSMILGFGMLPSIYIAVALTFSSTIVMVKLLSEKKDLSSLYGRISIGFLLIQDFVAVVILMFLAGLGRGDMGAVSYLFMGVKAILIFIGVWALSKKVLPMLFDRFIASSGELLFIVSIAWALGVAGFIAGPMGFTLEIGGFLAGLALSNLPEHLQIASKTKSLRDFFLTIFFIILGTKLVVSSGLFSILPIAVILAIFVLVGNPIIVMFLMGLLGYKKRTSFLAGLTVGQISEFSLIIVAMGLSLGHVGENVMAIVVLVGVITMAVSTYLILGADKVYKFVSPYLSIFERGKLKEGVLTTEHNMSDHMVLVGCDRSGKTLASFFQRRSITFIVVDFNPKVFNRLTADKIPVVFGDINDPDVFDAAKVEKSRILISTTSNLNDNLTLLEHIRGLKRKPVTVFTASTKDDAVKLYENGATYLVVPEIVAGEHIKHLLDIYGSTGNRLRKMGKSHFNRLIYK